jgi:hypothetical protein
MDKNPWGLKEVVGWTAVGPEGYLKDNYAAIWRRLRGEAAERFKRRWLIKPPETVQSTQVDQKALRIVEEMFATTELKIKPYLGEDDELAP